MQRAPIRGNQGLLSFAVRIVGQRPQSSRWPTLLQFAFVKPNNAGGSRGLSIHGDDADLPAPTRFPSFLQLIQENAIPESS